MTDQTAMARLRRLLAPLLSIGRDAGLIGPDDTLDGLGLDSLDRVEAVMAAEEEFGIEITDKEGEAWQTIGRLCDLIVAKLAAQ